MKTKLNLSIKTVMHLSCVVLSLVGLLFIFISLGNVDYNYSKIGLIILLGVMAVLCYVANGYLTRAADRRPGFRGMERKKGLTNDAKASILS